MEHLRHRHRLIETLVDEHPEDDRVGAMVSQADGPRQPRSLDPLGLVVTFDVTAKCPLLGFGARCLVVGDPVRRQQQSRDRIDHRGLPAADVAGEQRGVPIGSQAPDPLVKRAPVEHLDVA